MLKKKTKNQFLKLLCIAVDQKHIVAVLIDYQTKKYVYLGTYKDLYQV